jgi:hypothetical protein
MPAGILYPYPWLSSLLHLQRRCIPSRHERPLLAKERTILRNLASKSVIFGRTRFFYIPQSWDMGQIILPALRRKACCGFFQPKNSDSFGRERTRDFGYQASTQTPRPPKPLMWWIKWRYNHLQCCTNRRINNQYWELRSAGLWRNE